MAGSLTRQHRDPVAALLVACALLLAGGCNADREGDAAQAVGDDVAMQAMPDAAQAQRLLDSPQARDWQAQQDFRQEARNFLRDAASLPAAERARRADALEAQIAQRERSRELSAGEAMLLRAAMVQELSGSDAERARELAALAERYRQDAERREAAWAAQQRSDPRMQQYKAREKVVVAEVMAMATIPGGLTRDEYLRQRLQQERERIWSGG